MSRFGHDPRDYFDSAYREPAPWDLGGPQPALYELLAEHPPAGPILDVGCGTGNLSIALARDGATVLGVDLPAAAIEQARAKLAALPPDVVDRIEFRVADAFQLARLDRQFGAVVDSGFFHLFTRDDGDRFVRELDESGFISSLYKT